MAMAEHARTLRVANEWGLAKAHWESLRTGGLGKSIDGNREAHTDLIKELLSTVAKIDDSSLLNLDPDASSYYLKEAALDKFPAVSELGSRLAAHAAGALAEKSMDEARKARLIGEEAVFLAKAQEFESALLQAMASNPKVAVAMSTAPADLRSAAQVLQKLIHTNVLNAKLTLSVEEYWAHLYQYRQELEQANAALLPLLDELLAARIERLEREYFQSALVAGPVFLIVFLYLSAGAYLAVMASIQGLRDGAHRLAKGDFSTPIALPNKDELHSVAVSFNDMSQQLELRSAEARQHTISLEEINQKLEILSTTDGLTGIANRRYFDTTLAREWRKAQRTGQPLTVALLDVDWFKKYNDCYGHQAGDECLVRVAQVLSRGVGRAGDLVARYGGEEFAFIALNCDGEHAQGLAENICKALAELALPHAKSDFGVVTISVGVASMVSAADHTPESLLKTADQALYRAKETGRARVVVGH
jgi:diguanylate cyclase (GGDEF)-like protein